MNPDPHARAATTIGSASAIGVDIGQKNDPTAIAVVEPCLREINDQEQGQPRTESHYCVRFLQRLPLGTPYPEVARRIAEIWHGVGQRSGQLPRVFVDATGVGTPIVDLLRVEIPMATVWAVYFVHGQRRMEDRATQKVTLGKARMVSHLQALLKNLQIHLPQHSEARALAEELLSYEIRVSENGIDRFGAFRVGAHDDLVTALGLAIQDETAGPTH